MKLIINIPKDMHEAIKNNIEELRNETLPMHNILFDAIFNGHIIPDNTTNGDVIEVMFPQYTPKQCGFSIWLVDDTKGIEHAMDNARFDVDFWNAPYKADKEKKE